MTDERCAIELLGRCRLLPGSWDKRFIRDLNDRPEDYRLTTKQRAHLWRIAFKFRKQMGGQWGDIAATWLAVPADERAFREAIEADTDDTAPRWVFADWLDERGRSQEAEMHRFIAANGGGPWLVGAGASYGPDGTKPINFEWTFEMKMWRLFSGGPGPGLNYWNKSIEAAEADLLSVMARRRPASSTA
jgi:uncharacterized protein (TIGR02996 family)